MTNVTLEQTYDCIGVGIKPLLLFRITLDTPMNRKWMPKADTSTWTPLEYIAE